MHLFDEPKIDCHAHILDPKRFPYGPDNRFHPAAGEIGTLEQLQQVMAAYGVRHVLLVQPNSGYGPDNSYLLHALRQGQGRFRGIACIPQDADLQSLTELRAQGVLGAAINPTFDGLDHFRQVRPLLEKLAELDMFISLQVQQDDLLMFMPWLEEIPVRVLVDHCGRPRPGDTDSEAFRALLRLGESGRAWLKVSGYPKFSQQSCPFADVQAQVQQLIRTFTPARCLWGSDWPFLRPPERQDYGPLLKLAAEVFFPDTKERHAVFWDNPCQLFGFGES